MVNKDLMKGSVSILILSLLEREELYGYKIAQTLKSRSENVFELREGTLYPMLHGLENDGAIEARWESVGNKMRKYYRITDKGRKILVRKKKEWDTYTNAVNSVLEGGAFCYAG